MARRGDLCLTLLPLTFFPLMVDLSKGMGTLSNIAMAIAGGLMIFVLLTGPTHYLMSGITGAIGDYFAKVIPHGFQTYTFFDDKATTQVVSILDAYLHGLVVRLGSFRGGFHRTYIEGAYHTGVPVRRHTGANVLLYLLVRRFRRRWFLWSAGAQCGDSGGREDKRQRYDVLCTQAPAAVYCYHYSDGSGCFSFCGNERGERLFRTLHVFQRWRLEPGHQDEAHMGRNLGGSRTGYDPIE